MDDQSRSALRAGMARFLELLPEMLDACRLSTSGLTYKKDGETFVSQVSALLSRTDKNYMSRFYESWSKRERKGGRIKIRWLSKVTDTRVFSAMKGIQLCFNLPTSRYVYSYTPGVSIADCAACFTGMKSILSLDIRDFYYSITAKYVEELYGSFLSQGYARITPDAVKRIELIAKAAAFLLTAPDPRPADIRNASDNVLLQGTPHAGAVSNWALYKLDLIIEGICSDEGYEYARYSDNFFIGSHVDIISKEFTDRIISAIESFTLPGVITPPFKVKRNKTKLMVHNDHQRVLGIVVNQKMNISSYTEDMINANIANISKTFTDHYADAVRNWHPSSTNIIGRQALRRRMKDNRAVTRRLKGMVSYLGVFNALKYRKYADYVKFLEDREKIMCNISRPVRCIYPYQGNSSEGSRSGIAPGGHIVLSHHDLKYYIIIPSCNSEAMEKFVSAFPKGFLGIRYTSSARTGFDDIVIVPFHIPAQWLALADADMVASMKQPRYYFSNTPFRKICNGYPCSPLRMAISNIHNARGFTPFTNNPANQAVVSLRSVLIYNAENPDGFVPFENYDMSIREVFDIGYNVCVAKNDLDGPEVMYNALWKLRKYIIDDTVIITN